MAFRVTDAPVGLVESAAVGHTSPGGRQDSGRCWGAEDAAVCRKLAPRKVSQGCQGGSPGQSNSKSVQEGASRQGTRGAGPPSRRQPPPHVVGGDDRELRGRAGSDETQQVREEQVALVGAPVTVPSFGQDGGAVHK
jgi:hypothetical protein